jgi:hypothetical protein
MKAAIAHSAEGSTCVAGLRAQVSAPPRLVVYFASPHHDAARVAGAFRQGFPASAVIGCSTAGEIASGVMSEGGVAAMAIPREVIERLTLVTIDDVRDAAKIETAIAELETRAGGALRQLDPARHVGLVLVDGLSLAEEWLMERLGDVTDVPFVGGSAGDNMGFRATYVSADGHVFGHGAVLALLKVPHGYEIIKAQSFRSTGMILRATAVNERTRTVASFGGKPAAEAYVRALGMPREKLHHALSKHPLGLMVGREPYVRSPKQVLPDGSIVFHCRIAEGMELEILEATDIVSDMREALSGRVKEFGPVAGLLHFNCALRTLELKSQGQCEAYGRLFAGIPTAGFSTYGGEYLGHLNQTSTTLMLAEAP